MKFVEVDPDKFPNMVETHRGRVSYPILKSFLETGYKMAKMDREGMQQSLQSLYSSLNAYSRTHTMPVKVISRGGELHLLRLDILADGSKNPDWVDGKGLVTEKAHEEPVAITPDEVDRKFDDVAGDVTR